MERYAIRPAIPSAMLRGCPPRSGPGRKHFRRLAVHPDTSARRFERRHALSHQTADHAYQHIAGTGGREPRRRVRCDGSPAVRRSNDGVGTLEYDLRPGSRRGRSGAVELRSFQATEQPHEFAGMRRENDRAARASDGREQSLRRTRKRGQRIGVERTCALCFAGRERGLDKGARILADAEARPQRDCKLFIKMRSP